MFTHWHDTPLMWLSMTVFWSLIVLLFYYALRGRTRGRSPSSSRATEILAERFARGDISAEELRASREALETQPSDLRT
jgi:uncharacterized membrane protein